MWNYSFKPGNALSIKPLLLPRAHRVLDMLALLWGHMNAECWPADGEGKEIWRREGKESTKAKNSSSLPTVA